MLLYDFFRYFYSVLLARFGLKIATVRCRKMVLDKKFHITRGFHMNFHLDRPFWDVKIHFITAALSGDFFNAPKSDNFKAKFQLNDILNLIKLCWKTENGSFEFIFWLISLFCILKTLEDNFQALNWLKISLFQMAQFWHFFGNFIFLHPWSLLKLVFNKFRSSAKTKRYFSSSAYINW